MADLPKRHTIRRPGYDYAQQGAYYLTIVTDDRRPLFGHIADGVMHPSPIGTLAQQCWDAIPDHMPNVDVGDFVLMPNHVHGIVVIRERLVRVDGAVDVGARHDASDTNALHAPDTNVLDAPGIDPGDAPDTTTNPPRATNAPDDPGTGMPGGDPDTANAHVPHTRARHDVADAPPHDPRARHDAPLRDPRKPPGIPRGALGQIVASYKSAVTRMAYRDGLVSHGTPVWQRNYWDRVIRDDGEHERIAKYIQDNPKNWKGDRFNG
jgi:REP element-mobilizing transposase RayT